MARANVRQIEAFNAVMKAGSVTKAAESLFVSQPAVSKLVQAFESACGLPLFHRRSGRLVPTPEARQVFAETQKLEAGVKRVHDVARAIRELERGEVAIVAFPAISMKLIPRVTAAHIADRPDIKLSLYTRTSRSIEDSMITRAADFGISLVPTRNPALNCAPFAQIPMVCALPRDHKLAAAAAIPLERLTDERLVVLGRDDQSFPIIDMAFHRVGARMKAGIEVQMADAACMMVGEGCGVSIVPSLVSVPPLHPNVVLRPLAQRIEMTAWLITSAFSELSTVAATLQEQIRQAVLALEAELA